MLLKFSVFVFHENNILCFYKAVKIRTQT